MNAYLKNNLYLGRVYGDGSPILYPAELLMRGGWIQGAPGSGKTVMIMQLQEQLIEMGISVVNIDCKASSFESYYSGLAAIERVKQQQGRDVDVYLHTPVHGRPSHLLDIFNQNHWGPRSPEEKAGMISGYLGLNYPAAYGQDWYRDCAWMIEQHVTSKYPNLRSFNEVALRMADEMMNATEPWELSRQVKQDGEHPRIMLKRLGMHDAMNCRSTYAPEVLDNQIQLSRLFQRPSFMYCGLPAATDPIAYPEVGRVLLTSLLSAATHTADRPVQVVVFIDELQRMCGRQLDIVLQQARSRGMGVVLSNQSSADLVAIDPNMPDTILGNTSMQCWLKATDSLGNAQVQNLGGQYIELFTSISESTTDKGTSTSKSWKEEVCDRVSTGLVDLVNSSQENFFIRLAESGGYARYGSQMFVAKSQFHTTSDEYKERCQKTWPEKAHGMLVNGEHRPSGGPPSSSLLGPNPTKPKPSRQRRQRTTTPLTPDGK